MIKPTHIVLVAIALLLGMSCELTAYVPTGELGLPYITVFKPEDYDGMGQNWGISQADNGLFYLANGDGVFEYDGVDWTYLEEGFNRTARSIDTGPGQSVYVGYHNELGFYLPDSTGELTYTSLMERIPESLRDFRDVWTTLVFKDRVYFAAIGHMFSWQINEQGIVNGSLSIHVAAGESRYQGLTIVRDQMLFVDPASGLFEVKGSELVKIQDDDGANLRPVWSILPYLEDQYLLLGYEGVYVSDGKSIKRWRADVSDLCRESGAYNATALGDGYFALGTDDEGVVLFDSTGTVLKVVDRDLGLPNNQVLTYPYLDKEGGVWVCLDYGLARVDLISPLQRFNHSLGLEGGVVAMRRFKGSLYVGTSQGIYVPREADQSGHPVQFTELGSMLYCWDMQEVAGQLLIAGDGDVQVIRDVGQRPEMVAEGVYPFSIAVDSTNQRAFIGCTAGPIRSYAFRNGVWQDEGELASLDEDVMWLTRSPDGALWATYGFDSLSVARVEIEQTWESVEVSNVLRFNEANGYTEMVAGMPFLWGDDWMVSGYEMLYRWDAVQQALVPASDTPLFEYAVKHTISMPTMSSDHSIWFEDNAGICNHAILKDDGSFVLETPLRRTSTTGYNSFYTENGTLWAGLVGLHLVRYDYAADNGPEQEHTTLIRDVRIGVNESRFNGATQHLTLLQQPVSWSDRTVRINYAMPCYEDVTRNEYQVRLVGLSETWSDWTQDTHQLYNNLAAGQYRFEVRGRDVHGSPSKIASVRFFVSPPWYATWWATTLWLVLAISLTYGLIKLRLRAIELRSKRLDELVKQRTAELEQLREAEREAEIKASQMETAYKMAATIAHEFNNPLAIIQASSQLMQKDEFDEYKLREFADKIPPQVTRLKELLHRIRTVDDLREIDYAAGMKILDIHHGKPGNGVHPERETNSRSTRDRRN